MSKIVLQHAEPNLNANSEELAGVVIQRLGLMPRKKGSTERMNVVFLQMYEKAKEASREKNPTKAVITVEEMALHAHISRQTMYEYLERWLALDFIVKQSYIGSDNKVVVGYRLNGTTLESAFDKAKVRISNHLDLTSKYIQELQKVLKNEKISQSISHSVRKAPRQRELTEVEELTTEVDDEAHEDSSSDSADNSAEESTENTDDQGYNPQQVLKDLPKVGKGIL